MEAGGVDVDIHPGETSPIESDTNDLNYGYDLHQSTVEFPSNDPSRLLGRGVRLYKQNLVEATSSDYCMSPHIVDGYFSPSVHSQCDSNTWSNERVSVKSLVNSFNKQIASHKSSADKSSDKSSVDHGNSPFLTYTSSIEDGIINHSEFHSSPTGRTLPMGPENYNFYQMIQQQDNHINYPNNFNDTKIIHDGRRNLFSIGYNHLLHNDMFDISYMAERGMIYSFNHFNGAYTDQHDTCSLVGMNRSGRKQSIGFKNSFSNSDRIFVIKRGLARICWEPDFEWQTIGVAIFECDQSNIDFHNEQLPHSNISNFPTFNLSNSILFNFSNPDHYDRDEYNFGGQESEKYLITYSDPTLWDVSKTIVNGSYIRAFKIEQYGNKDSLTLLNMIKSGIQKLFQPFLIDETWSSFKAYPLDANSTPLADPAVSTSVGIDDSERGKPVKLFVEFIEEFKSTPQPSPARQSKPTSVKDLTLAVNVFSLVKKRH
ncbi:hypothetical protein BMR1_02g03535 [Babesia microti strain RI]|uniref:Uncharacterized protein n=1 Tax=Babesia microti (strain RI) TaxID=1133968 RepID=I7JAM7_BABMR|nr:hypothetical protein BMR1_02g03535 [Babesia microti strain RI]CCF73859.1 hypothetical protein BMR1_02g03535 [Babesia microti strain RI]|eukprot:XP_012648468.1 hypothetical protein BMR1_02g03535 [Babesia microti strain RI]